MIAWLFIGQGAEQPWVQPDVVEHPRVAPLVQLAAEECRLDLARLLIRGGRELERTEVQQPAMVAVCLGLVRLLVDRGLHPDLVLGHSLGELTAWAAAGGIDDEVAVRIAAARGRAMAREADRVPGGMVRLVCDRATCERVIAETSRVGSLYLGARNGGNEWALSGDTAALAFAIAHFGATRLPLGGAWHSPLMAGALEELYGIVRAAPCRPMRARLIANRDGSVATAANVTELVVEQLVRTVDFAACAETLAASTPTRLIVVGPGKIMRALVYRNLGVRAPVEIVDGIREIERL